MKFINLFEYSCGLDVLQITRLSLFHVFSSLIKRINYTLYIYFIVSLIKCFSPGECFTWDVLKGKVFRYTDAA